MMRFCYGAAFAATVLFTATISAAQQSWVHHGSVCSGGQLDAVPGSDGNIHVQSDRYYVITPDGTVANTPDMWMRDLHQGSMDFPPAIALGADGTAHTVQRGSGGWSDGYELFQRSCVGGVWNVRPYGEIVPRNYVVGIAAAADGSVYMHHTESLGNVWGPVHIYQRGESSAPKAGELTGIWRTDTDARMRAFGNTIYLVSGLCDSNGKATFTWATAGSTLVSQMTANKKTHQSGTGRRGFPDLYIDGTGNAHLTYGAYETIHYNRYSAGHARALANDVTVMDNLGEWHLSAGLSAVAASHSGDTVVVVGLRSDGSERASDCDILWSMSNDGGVSWSSAADLGKNTDAGEGRRRPRLVYLNGTFYLLYVDKNASGVSMASLTVAEDTPVRPGRTDAGRRGARPAHRYTIDGRAWGGGGGVGLLLDSHGVATLDAGRLRQYRSVQ